MLIGLSHAITLLFTPGKAVSDLEFNLRSQNWKIHV